MRRAARPCSWASPVSDTMLSMRALGTVYGARTVRGSWYGSFATPAGRAGLLALHAAGKLELEPLSAPPWASTT